MKAYNLALAPMVAALLVSGCGGIGVLDNYDQPESTLSGA